MEERGEYVNFRAEVQPSGNGMLTGTFSSSGTHLATSYPDAILLRKLSGVKALEHHQEPVVASVNHWGTPL